MKLSGCKKVRYVVCHMKHKLTALLHNKTKLALHERHHTLALQLANMLWHPSLNKLLK